METLPLYMDSGVVTGPSNAGNTSSSSREEESASSAVRLRSAHADDVSSRESALVRPGERISFATYFNAFPASYWRRWTNLKEVRLSVTTAGAGTVSVYKSNARGSLQHVETTRVSGDEVTTTYTLSLAPFGDGGWYWFEVTAGADQMEFVGARWETDAPRRLTGSVTVEITTLNKTDFCVNNLRILSENPDALAAVKEIIVVDQGTQKVAEAEGFEEVAGVLGSKLRMINQDNLGGSGGFARGMYEAVENGSDYVLLLDDDVVVEPESIVRLSTFADYCKKPTLVGGHMFDLHDRNVLHTLGEIVDPYLIGPSEPNASQKMRHNFAQSNLRDTAWMHRRVDVDYNGWWMCLIPTEVIREIGLSLPVFIKWDDSEYGVRAKSAGYHTVSLPGSAVWHVSWIDKDDLVGWQAYFHSRNRFIYALLHSPYPRGGGLIENALKLDLKHTISMQYYTAQGRIEAMRDLLRGPSILHDILPTKLPAIRAMAGDYTETKFKPSVDDFPDVKITKLPRRGKRASVPSIVTIAPWLAKNILRQVVLPANEVSKEHPQALVPHEDNKWWRMSQYDSAVVSNAEGSAASWYQRDPRAVRELMKESAVVYSEVLRKWPELRAQYRAALQEITSFEAWKKTFDAHSGQD
ncbi:glycosyltransferase family 2 protein [Paenarthrobacter sp. DKR-5]|uniref:glycosyltransferase n=1 Tax=Paenarthrobacter sp. DKR-5 TaxID=2835535 RepID=UPI001BDCCF39|nr:glycosyltransferase [Paenarthrobacter sp. DKR-5]MBT1003031.1 glycosyltransferase family 2 protein [Paenarthrobacter sp. DKR-5]